MKNSKPFRISKGGNPVNVMEKINDENPLDNQNNNLLNVQNNNRNIHADNIEENDIEI